MRNLRKTLSMAVSHWIFALVMLAPLNAPAAQSPGYKNINTTQLRELMAEDVPLYDVRRKDEWRRTGVIEGSHRLTFMDRRGRLEKNFLPRFTAQVNKDQPVIVMCRTGDRSDVLARYLVNKLGYTQVYNLRDGIVSWIYEQKPVVSP